MGAILDLCTSVVVRISLGVRLCCVREPVGVRESGSLIKCLLQRDAHEFGELPQLKWLLLVWYVQPCSEMKTLTDTSFTPSGKLPGALDLPGGVQQHSGRRLLLPKVRTRYRILRGRFVMTRS